MKASVLYRSGEQPRLGSIDLPNPQPNHVRIRVEACALCRTDLHVIDGDLPNPKYPLVLGHEIVGIVEELGDSVSTLSRGERVGVPWLASTCMECAFCLSGDENLCDHAMFTGYTIDGGFAEYALADSRFCFPIPQSYDPSHAAPLLCAGLIGWRCLKVCGDSRNIGLFGFGAAAHVITPVAIHLGKNIFAFTSPGDAKRQAFAAQLGAVWTGGSDDRPGELLDAAIIFAPVGALVPKALSLVRKGGMVVCGGIHMSEIPSFAYSLLWGERSVRSIANLTRADGHEFFELVSRVGIDTRVVEFDLADTNRAIAEFRSGHIQGAAVIRP